ncbi:MAG TPA: hypothetical protein VF768_05850 [Holophagaceae bacterium]
MSLFARPAARWSALVALWGLVLAVLWVGLVQVFLLVMNPFCRWQGPGVAHVKVVRVDPDPQSQIADLVTVKEGDRTRDLTMLKAEASRLEPDDEIWVLDNYVADGLRPNQFRLTPLRVLLEYPFLLLLPVGWALWHLRRIRIQAEAEPPPPVRRVFTDDFHLRAQRFAKPAEGSGDTPPKDDPHP